jgi:hypothetical protein
MNSVDYMKAKLNRRKEPTFYEIVDSIANNVKLSDLYKPDAIKRQVLKALKKGYIEQEPEGFIPRRIHLTDKAKEFFTMKHL